MGSSRLRAVAVLIWANERRRTATRTSGLACRAWATASSTDKGAAAALGIGTEGGSACPRQTTGSATQSSAMTQKCFTLQLRDPAESESIDPRVKPYRWLDSRNSRSSSAPKNAGGIFRGARRRSPGIMGGSGELDSQDGGAAGGRIVRKDGRSRNLTWRREVARGKKRAHQNHGCGIGARRCNEDGRQWPAYDAAIRFRSPAGL
jgi:hypothetical protein